MESKLSFVCDTLDDTFVLSAVVAAALCGGDVLGFRGPLGAGKTEFVRGLCAALGAGDEVTSPTFVFEHIYQAFVQEEELSIHHWDLYRLRGSAEEFDLFEEIGDKRKILLVEWPERAPGVSEALSLVVQLSYRTGSTGRLISLSAERDDHCYQRIMRALQNKKEVWQKRL